MDITEIKENSIKEARQQAQQKNQQISMTAAVADSQLTTYDDIIGDYHVVSFTTSSNRVFNLQPITSGSLFIVTGSPLLNILSGAENGDKQQVLENLSDSEKLSLVTDDSYIEFMQRCCCIGIISLNFVMKRQDKCDKLKKEISIDLLDGNDLLEIFGHIMQISGMGESAGDMVNNFRSEGEAEQE